MPLDIFSLFKGNITERNISEIMIMNIKGKNESLTNLSNER